MRYDTFREAEHTLASQHFRASCLTVTNVVWVGGWVGGWGSFGWVDDIASQFSGAQGHAERIAQSQMRITQAQCGKQGRIGVRGCRCSASSMIRGSCTSAAHDVLLS